MKKPARGGPEASRPNCSDSKVRNSGLLCTLLRRKNCVRVITLTQSLYESALDNCRVLTKEEAIEHCII